MARSFINMSGYPLGMRLNNPGNLMYNGDQWQGMTQLYTNSAGQYYVFKDISWGIRAMATDLRSKINRGVNTIAKIVEVYAPRIAHNNQTDAYITAVANYTGINPYSALTADRMTLKRLVRAMINFENGPQYSAIITDAEIDEGIDLMSGGVPPVAIVGLGISGLVLIGAIYLLVTTRNP